MENMWGEVAKPTQRLVMQMQILVISYVTRTNVSFFDVTTIRTGIKERNIRVRNITT